MCFQLKRNDWESAFFGRAIATLHLPKDDEIITDTPLPNHHFRLIHAKIPSSHLHQRTFLTRHAFHYVDTELVFRLTLTAKPNVTLDKHIITTANLADITPLQTLFGEAFQQSRFRPPYFSTAENRLFYQKWIENAVKGRFDHLCLIEKHEETGIRGIISLRLISSQVKVGLLAVATHARGQGVATRLLEYAKLQAKKWGAESLAIHTQLTNHPACSCYVASGAVVCERYDWFYQSLFA